jgi:hypothetical protein
MRTGLLGITAGLALACASCKPDATSAGPSASAPPATHDTAEVEAFCQQAFGTLVDQALKGCSPEERASNEGRNAAEFAREPLYECNRLKAGVSAGRLAFDAAAAPACVKGTTATKRVDGTWGGLAVPDLDESPACNAVFVGKQAEGAPCSTTLDCKEPLTCLGATDEGKPDGTCKPVPSQAGAACDAVFLRVTDFKHRPRCGAGLSCDPVDDVCKPPVAAGGACKNSFECASPAACRAGHCVTSGPADVGGPCEDDTDDCKPGLYCDKTPAAAKTAGGAAGVCAEKKAAGAACTQDLFECRGECKKPEGKCASRCGSG